MMNLRIFIVEDERIPAADLRCRLENFGYKIAGLASTGEEALKMVDELRPDLVLMDIKIKGPMDGVETATRIRTSMDIPVVYVTAYADQVTMDRIRKSEPYGLITKPYEDNELQGVIETAFDRYRLEKRLRESEAWLNTTLRSIAEAVIAADVNGRVMFMNPAAEAMTGWRENKAKGLRLEDVFRILSEPDEREIGDPMKRIMEQPLKGDLLERNILVAKNGNKVLIDSSGSRIKTAQGAVIGIVLVFRDVTELKRAEEALRESEIKYRNLVDNAPIAVYKSALDGRLLYGNRALWEYSGFTSVDDLNRVGLPNCYVRKEDREKIIRELREKGKVDNVEVEIMTKSGGHKTILLNGIIEGDTLSGMLVDITDKVKNQEEVQRLGSIIEIMSDLVATAWPDGRIIYMNRAGRRMLGWGEDESLAGLIIASVYSRQEYEYISDRGIPAAVRDGVWRGRTAIKTRDGQEIPVSQIIMAHFSRDGTLEYLSTIIRSIPE